MSCSRRDEHSEYVYTSIGGVISSLGRHTNSSVSVAVQVAGRANYPKLYLGVQTICSLSSVRTPSADRCHSTGQGRQCFLKELRQPGLLNITCVFLVCCSSALVAPRSNHLPLFIQMTPLQSDWSYAGLKGIIPSVLHYSLLGYNFFIPDAVGNIFL